MTVTEALLAAVPLLIAGIGTPTIIGGYRWLRAVSAAVGKLTEVTRQLGDVTEAQAELSRLIRATRRELALHVRECRHTAAAERPAYAGPDRRRVLPHPRATAEAQ